MRQRNDHSEACILSDTYKASPCQKAAREGSWAVLIPCEWAHGGPAQAHCKRELTPSFGAWKQNLLLEAEAVIRSCGAHIPVSRLYTGDAGGSQKAPDGSMANASNQ